MKKCFPQRADSVVVTKNIHRIWRCSTWNKPGTCFRAWSWNHIWSWSWFSWWTIEHDLETRPQEPDSEMLIHLPGPAADLEPVTDSKPQLVSEMAMGVDSNNKSSDAFQVELGNGWIPSVDDPFKRNWWWVKFNRRQWKQNHHELCAI